MASLIGRKTCTLGAGTGSGLSMKPIQLISMHQGAGNNHQQKKGKANKYSGHDSKPWRKGEK